MFCFNGRISKRTLKYSKLSKSFESKQFKYESNSSRFLQALIIIGLSSYLNINSNEKSNDSKIVFFSFFLCFALHIELFYTFLKIKKQLTKELFRMIVSEPSRRCTYVSGSFVLNICSAFRPYFISILRTRESTIKTMAPYLVNFSRFPDMERPLILPQ